MPIETTASGGEISRLMLCVKTILAEKMKLPTIVLMKSTQECREKWQIELEK